MPFCVIPPMNLSKWGAHLHGSQALVLIQKKTLSRREERQCILQNPSSLLLGRDISILCFQETLADGVSCQVLQWTSARSGHSWLPQGCKKWDRNGERSEGRKIFKVFICVVSQAQLTMLHAVQADTSKALQNCLLYSITWELAKDDVQLLALNIFYSRKCVYASKEQPLPRKTKYQTINKISHNPL